MSICERRLFSRYGLTGIWCVLAFGSGSAVECELKDVSLRGVGLCLGDGYGPSPGEHVRLSGCDSGELAGLLSSRPARVVWRWGSALGLELSRPLAELPACVTGRGEKRSGPLWTSY